MKQHITPVQLNELSNKAKITLRFFWQPHKGDFFVDQYNNEFVCNDHEPLNNVGWINSTDWDGAGGYELIQKSDALPLLSIGQMLEFLHNILRFFDITDYGSGIRLKVKTWNGGLEYKNFNLCDALWDAVKFELERK
jgi:hypothetical protein